MSTILRYPYLVTDPKIFQNFEGGARAKKRDFLVNIFQKEPKNAFFCLFFKNLWGSLEIHFVRP